MNKNLSIALVVVIILGIAVFAFTKDNTKNEENILVDTSTENEVQSGYNLENPEIVGEVTLGQTFTLAELATHKTDADCYTAIDGIVYDLTAWVYKHPGGDKNILRICGIDGTSAFQGQHGDAEKPNNVLEGFEIGTLAN